MVHHCTRNKSTLKVDTTKLMAGNRSLDSSSSDDEIPVILTGHTTNLPPDSEAVKASERKKPPAFGGKDSAV